VRASNALKTANIRTIADLVQKTEAELSKTKNFGKSPERDQDHLARWGCRRMRSIPRSWSGCARSMSAPSELGLIDRKAKRAPCPYNRCF